MKIYGSSNEMAMSNDNIVVVATDNDVILYDCKQKKLLNRISGFT